MWKGRVWRQTGQGTFNFHKWVIPWRGLGRHAKRTPRPNAGIIVPPPLKYTRKASRGRSAWSQRVWLGGVPHRWKLSARSLLSCFQENRWGSSILYRIENNDQSTPCEQENIDCGVSIYLSIYLSIYRKELACYTQNLSRSARAWLLPWEGQDKPFVCRVFLVDSSWSRSEFSQTWQLTRALTVVYSWLSLVTLQDSSFSSGQELSTMYVSVYLSLCVWVEREISLLVANWTGTVCTLLASRWWWSLAWSLVSKRFRDYVLTTDCL